ncbi:MAG TPA: penicillin-binding transpeptidase domain-containing protein [Solirubrobacteraceae bacterium]|nr:penicillin-binding transpeptidase domain-containing protein [Solirubrobacteraceae bacterium]
MIIATAVAVTFAAVALVTLLTGGRPAEQVHAEAFAAAWARADYPAMHAELTSAARRATPLAKFIAQYKSAAATATTVRLLPGKAGKPVDGVVSVPMTISTRVFGPVRGTLRLPFAGKDDAARIDWTANLTFPGVRRGETLERHMQLPRRADLLARDGTPLAQGPDRTSPIADVAGSIVGELGPAPVERVEALRALGFPDDARVGISGLERVFDEKLAGRPGGVLQAGGRTLASSIARTSAAVRTSIDPDVQRAAVLAKGARLGGVAAVRPRTGEILALSGIAFSGLQPPGSTFKIVTLTGVLQAKLAGPHSVYPVETKATIEGRDLENANGEACGGSLRNAFAESCNSVFAPLGARLGPDRLVKTAEAFGFNEDLGIPGAATSTIPPAGEIGDSLAVASSAIGQGRVQATALQMALVAATIAGRGRRPKLTLERRSSTPRRQTIPESVARQVGRLMEAVVNEGTGKAAQITGVRVAGKTGTAELRETVQQDCIPSPEVPECPPPLPNDPTDTDAWFSAYAPAAAPRIAVGVLLVEAGAGGDTAAPVAKQVLVAGLKATR